MSNDDMFIADTVAAIVSAVATCCGFLYYCIRSYMKARIRHPNSGPTSTLVHTIEEAFHARAPSSVISTPNQPISSPEPDEPHSTFTIPVE